MRMLMFLHRLPTAAGALSGVLPARIVQTGAGSLRVKTGARGKTSRTRGRRHAPESEAPWSGTTLCVPDLRTRGAVRSDERTAQLSRHIHLRDA